MTIPFFGVQGSAFPVPASTDGGKLYAASGGTAAVSPTTLPNPNYKGFADFRSAGPGPVTAGSSRTSPLRA